MKCFFCGRPSEFLQAGIESFGRQDRAAADAEMLALALEATAACGLKDVEIRTGDVALFTALIDALDLYPVWRRRLIKDFNRRVSLTEDIERQAIQEALRRTNGIMTEAARTLHITRRMLRYKMDKLQIRPSHPADEQELDEEAAESAPAVSDTK